MFNKRTTGFTITVALILTVLTPSFAAFYYNRAYMTSNPLAVVGGVLWSMAEYIDFSSTSPYPGRLWDANGANEKFAYFQIFSQPGGGNQCFEVSTAKGTNGLQQAETPSADTKLTVLVPNSTKGWVVINSDFGGTKYSKMRIWANSATNLVGYVSPANSSFNNIDFYLITKNLKLTSLASCTADNTIAWVNTTVFPYTYSQK